MPAFCAIKAGHCLEALFFVHSKPLGRRGSESSATTVKFRIGLKCGRGSRTSFESFLRFRGVRQLPDRESASRAFPAQAPPIRNGSHWLFAFLDFRTPFDKQRLSFPAIPKIQVVFRPPNAD